MEKTITSIRFRFAAGIFSCWLNADLLYEIVGTTNETWTGIRTIRIKGHVQIDDVKVHGNVYPQNFETRFIGGLKENQWIRAFFTFPGTGPNHDVTLSLQNQEKQFSFNVTAYVDKTGLWTKNSADEFINQPFEKKDLLWFSIWYEKSGPHLEWSFNAASGKMKIEDGQYNFDVLKISGTAELIQIELLDLVTNEGEDQCRKTNLSEGMPTTGAVDLSNEMEI